MAMDRGPWTISTRQLTDPHINLIPRFLSFFFLFLFFSSQIAPFYAFSTTQQTTPHTTKSTPRLQTGSAISRTVRGKRKLQHYSHISQSLSGKRNNKVLFSADILYIHRHTPRHIKKVCSFRIPGKREELTSGSDTSGGAVTHSQKSNRVQ